MKIVKEPTHKKYITGETARFDVRKTAFSIGAVAGILYLRGSGRRRGHCIDFI